MINTFRDRLMTSCFDTFRNLLSEINELKADLQKQRRRVQPRLDAIIGYRAIKEIASPLNKIFNYKRYSQETSIDMFCHALKKLDLFIRELKEFNYNHLAQTMQHIYKRLFVLLPEDTVIQHNLFDTDRYQSRSSDRQQTAAKVFLDWLRNYQLQGFVRRDIERVRNRKTIYITQFSLRLTA